MRTTRDKLIREAARKDVDEDAWRKRLERWIDPVKVSHCEEAKRIISDIRRGFAMFREVEYFSIEHGGRSIIVPRKFKLGEVVRDIYALLDS